jgi:hypothetical protein
MAWLAMAPAMLLATAAHAGRHAAGEPTHPTYVAYNFDVAIDQVAAGESAKVGDHDHLRVIVDRAQLDAKTHQVKLVTMQHLKDGKYDPEHPDAVVMPVDDAWLDLSRKPYALHYNAKVTHGKPIIIDISEHTHRLTLHPQEHPDQILISGIYKIDPRPVTGPGVDAAATPGR